MQRHSFAQNRTGPSVALNFYYKDSLASTLTLAGLRKTACRLSTRHDRKDNIQQSTSNIQKGTKIQAPKDNSRVTFNREVWDLELGSSLDVGSWMWSLPSLRSLRLVIGKSGARWRPAIRCR